MNQGKAILIACFFIIGICFVGYLTFPFIQSQLSNGFGLNNESTPKDIAYQKIAEEEIGKITKRVVDECKIYLEKNPELLKEEFENHPEFRNIAVQKVGKTGYTALYELADENGVWHVWAHMNPKIVGINMQKLQPAMGISFDDFWRIFTGVTNSNQSNGYYDWVENDGVVRKKYMTCRIIEDTRYVIAATTYIDEYKNR
jgi:hypothetical protein